MPAGSRLAEDAHGGDADDKLIRRGFTVCKREVAEFLAARLSGTEAKGAIESSGSTQTISAIGTPGNREQPTTLVLTQLRHGLQDIHEHGNISGDC